MVTAAERSSMLPDFLVIGTYRSGTTWLHEVLRRHPDVLLPDEKETMFFSHNYHKGLAWYGKFFAGWNGERCIAEVCPPYLSSDQAPERIRKHLPGVRLMVCLRRPAEQIESMYNLHVRRGISALDPMSWLSAKPHVLHDVLYGHHLRRYLALFDRRQLLITFYDDLCADPAAYLLRLFNFVGLPAQVPADLPRRVNSAAAVRNGAMAKAMARSARWLRRSGLVRAKAVLNRSGVAKLMTAEEQAPRIPLPDDARRLISLHTEQDRLLLGELAGRDLNSWT